MGHRHLRGATLTRLRTAAPRVIALFALALPLTYVSLGRGQVNGSTDAAMAEAAFEEGKSALRRGEVAKACALLETSRSLDPALGTALTLAHCYDTLGKTASAWLLFQEVEAWARRLRDDDREEIARVRATALETRLIRAEFEFESRADGQLPGYAVILDGVQVDPAAWALTFPIDPGAHVVRVDADDHQSWQSTFDADVDGRSLKITIPTLEPVVAKARPAVAPDAAATLKAGVETESSETSHTWAYVTGGAGALALGAGGVAALLAHRTYQRSEEACRTETRCSERGVELRDDAFRQADYATVLTAGGVVLLSTSAVLFITGWGETTQEEVQVSVSPLGAVWLTGSF